MFPEGAESVLSAGGESWGREIARGRLQRLIWREMKGGGVNKRGFAAGTTSRVEGAGL